MCDVLTLSHRLLARRIIVAFVQTSRNAGLRPTRGRAQDTPPRWRPRVRASSLVSWTFAGATATANGPPPACHPQAPFGAVFGPISGIWADFVAAPAGFSQRGIHSLSSPVKLPEFFTFSNEQRPYLLKQTDLFPSLKGSVKSRIITINRGDMVPLVPPCGMRKSSRCFARKINPSTILRASSRLHPVVLGGSYSTIREFIRSHKSSGTCRERRHSLLLRHAHLLRFWCEHDKPFSAF